MNRLEFSAATKRATFQRSGGICECHRIAWFRRPQGCGARLGVGNTFYEHVEPDNIRHDASIENCAALTKTCWQDKTSGYDRKVIAKSNHTRDRARGIDKMPSRPLPGTKRSGIALPFRGGPVDRSTGERWGARR